LVGAARDDGLIVDAHKVLTDDRLDTMWKMMTSGPAEFRFVWTSTPPRGLVRAIRPATRRSSSPTSSLAPGARSRTTTKT
jgi:hypothetical protein